MFARHRSCDPTLHSITTKNPLSYIVLPWHWSTNGVSCVDLTAFPLDPYEVGLSAPKPSFAYILRCCQWLPTETIRATLEISFAHFRGTVWLVQVSWRPLENISSPPLSKIFSLLHPFFFFPQRVLSAPTPSVPASDQLQKAQQRSQTW